jgi:hypothetical protein
MEKDGLYYQEGMELCEKLEKACVIHSNVDGVVTLDLQRQSRGAQPLNFLHNINFGLIGTTEVHCTTFEQNMITFD